VLELPGRGKIGGLIILTLLMTLAGGCGEQAGPRLVAIAHLPADTFRPGPTSGQFIEAARGRTPPFAGRQPVQGISDLVSDGESAWLALADNGFGTRENSLDFVLVVYRLRPDPATGTVDWREFCTLRDPVGLIGFAITADRESYDGEIPVAPEIRRERWLTGADLDPESLRRAPDGTLWIGDEFGPFLVHFDATGRLLEPPIPLPGVASPQNPHLGGRQPNLPSSGGFEGLALDPDGRRLIAILERPLSGQPDRQLNLYAYDLATKTWTHSQPDDPAHRYRLDPSSHGVCALTALADGSLLAIERDAEQGAAARSKRLYGVTPGAIDGDGCFAKSLVLDLLAIPDPDNLAGAGTGFHVFAWETPESVAVGAGGTLILINDNNYPSGKGRLPDDGQPDHSEWIEVRVSGL